MRVCHNDKQLSFYHVERSETKLEHLTQPILIFTGYARDDRMIDNLYWGTPSKSFIGAKCIYPYQLDLRNIV